MHTIIREGEWDGICKLKCTIQCAVVDRPNARPNFFTRQRTTKGHCDRVCFAVKYHVNAVKKIPGIRAGFFRLIEARKLLYLAAAELNAPLSLSLFGEGVEMQRCRDARLERGNSIDRRYQSRETIPSGGGGESIVRP